jgi:hypothetical protein
MQRLLRCCREHRGKLQLVNGSGQECTCTTLQSVLRMGSVLVSGPCVGASCMGWHGVYWAAAHVCRIISALVEEARRQKCYKIILDCSEHNVDFYAKSGFVRKEVQMVGSS